MEANLYHLRIKDMPEDERPRERLCKYGPETLRTAELLALLINTGSREFTAIQLGEQLLQKYEGNLKRMSHESPVQLARGIKGLGVGKTSHIAAAFELGRRLAAYMDTDRVQIRGPEDVVQLLMSALRGRTQETLHVLCLDTKNFVTRRRQIFEGSLNASIIHPREIFKFAIQESAASIVLVHNHPSGDPTPSGEDIRATRQIADAGKLLEIPLLDHVILGDGRFVSFKERQLI